jgi:hypothetical protein
MIRQRSLPKNEKEQDALAKKWEQSLKKSGLKSKKCNKGVDFAVHGPKHTFKVTTVKSKKKSPKTKVFIHPSTGRKFTITDVPKTRKKRGGRKRRRRTKKKRRRRTKKKRKRRRRKTRRRKGGQIKRIRTTTTTTTAPSSVADQYRGEPVSKKAKTETQYEII